MTAHRRQSAARRAGDRLLYAVQLLTGLVACLCILVVIVPCYLVGIVAGFIGASVVSGYQDADKLVDILGRWMRQ